MPVLQIAQTSINLPQQPSCLPCIRGNSTLSHRPSQSSPAHSQRNKKWCRRRAAPSTTAFYILITSHNKTGGNQEQAGWGKAINSDSGRRRKKKTEEDRKSGDKDLLAVSSTWKRSLDQTFFAGVVGGGGNSFDNDLRLDAHRVFDETEITESV